MQLKQRLFFQLVGALCLRSSFAVSRWGSESVWQRPSRGGSQLPSNPLNMQQSPEVIPEYYQEPPTHETVQDGIDTWRSQQRQRAEATQYSPRDDQGRPKLLISVSKGSRIVIFFVLMLRDIHLYEVADATRKGLSGFLRDPFNHPLSIQHGGCLCFSRQSIAQYEKATQGDFKFGQVVRGRTDSVLFVSIDNIPPAHIPRELFIANIFHSVFFVAQAQACTRFSWDEAAAPPINSYAVQQQGQNARPFPPMSYAQYDNQPEQPLQSSVLADESFEDTNYP